MKYIITIFTLLISLNILSQIDYPRFIKDSLGQTVVVITIEQAQVLDNKADLLTLFKTLNMQIVDYDALCVKVVNEKEDIIAKQDIQISNLIDLNDNKDQQIYNLKEQIVNYVTKEVMWSDEIINKDKEIKLHLDKIDEQRRKMIIGASVGSAVIVGLVYLLLNN